MHFTLLGQAEMLHDLIPMELEEPVSDSAQDHSESMYAGDMWEFLQQACLRNMMTNKSMRQGHCKVIGYIAVCLRANGLPTVGNILQDARLASEWPPYTRAYLNRGAAAGVSESAMIGPVLNGVCDVAKEQDDQTGDGSFMAPFHEDIQKPVKCNNDYASGFVLGAVNACSIGGVLRNQGSTIQG